MGGLTATESTAIEVARGQSMLDQVLAWSAINSGTRNLHGVAAMATALGDAFASLPGAIELVEPTAVETVGADGRVSAIDHGRHFLLTVRPEAPLQLLLTGHMDTVYPADHPFQETRWIASGTLNGPGVADMKGGIAVMLAALKGVEASAAEVAAT